MSPKPATGRRRWIALVVVCLGQLMVVLDATIVNVALPSIQRDLQFTQANLTWVLNAYLIAFGSFLLMAGRLGDLLGRKRIFVAGLALFTSASALCGLADSQALLIVARLVQGLGAAVTSAVVLAILVTEFPQPGERAKAMSVYMFVVTSGGSAGLLAGGVLTEAISWHWIFFVNLPIGLVTIALASALIAERPGIGLGEGIDVLGSVLVTVAMMVGVYAIVTSTDHGWGSAHTLGLGGVSLALLAAFLRLQARLANPIMPLRILRLRSLAASSAVRGLLVTGLFSSFFLGVLYLQHVLGYGTVRAGLAFLPQTLAIGALALGVTAWLMRRFGLLRTLVGGQALMIAGLLLFARADAHAAYFPDVFVPLLLTGLGAGIGFMPLLTMAMADVPQRDAGLASGVVNVSMQIAAAIGVAVLGTLAADHTAAQRAQGSPQVEALTSGYELGFVVAAACVAASVVLALALLR
ncbi:MAG: MFS transporter, partial [Conexibacter sp.]